MKTAEEIVNEIYPEIGTVDADTWDGHVDMVESFAKERAKEAFKGGESFGYRMVSLGADVVNSDRAFDEWYDEFINSEK